MDLIVPNEAKNPQKEEEPSFCQSKEDSWDDNALITDKRA
jgi:hypothetical protein